MPRSTTCTRNTVDWEHLNHPVPSDLTQTTAALTDSDSDRKEQQDSPLSGEDSGGELPFLSQR